MIFTQKQFEDNADHPIWKQMEHVSKDEMSSNLLNVQLETWKHSRSSAGLNHFVSKVICGD